ncbi:DUF5677 domain-containing protein [Sphingomonas sp. NSE70-1]|uniref:DUF5677 domain-containing protein n=1 Tax=Sphingomonas caseinilyticus TaxID=2908205 RepID=A0ABT0RX49_9SPHN|nr:DUF5677 domain-containing protein [Sphingomonas caseinilyticus]MCL6699583.1 DUF5677 domain-containing protein [Sphingomonas caseinilyticus]
MSTQYDAIGRFGFRLCQNISDNLTERTADFRGGDGFETAVNSVLSTLLARQSALAIGLAESPLTWSGHIAPLVLRSMIDLLITYRWILLDPRQRSQEYISYGLGTEKLLTAHYQQKLEDGFEGADVKRIMEANMAWIESQQFQMFIAVNLGSWSGSSVRKMCDEIGDPDLYKFSYTPFSSCVHNMWNHVGKWNARTCDNPLHKQHAVGVIRDVWPIVDFVFRACKYLELVLDEFDRYYEYSSNLDTPITAFNAAVQELSEEWEKEDD